MPKHKPIPRAVPTLHDQVSAGYHWRRVSEHYGVETSHQLIDLFDGLKAQIERVSVENAELHARMDKAVQGYD